MPAELEYIWRWYCQLCTSQHISFVEIRAWGHLTGVTLLPWETEVLMDLDRLRWKVAYE